MSENEQTKFKNIEEFLAKDIYKIPVPEDLGEAPEYAPKKTSKSRGGKKPNYGKGKKNNGHSKKKTPKA